MRKNLLSVLIMCSIITSLFGLAFSADSATQGISATLTRPVVPPGGGGGGGAVAIGVGAGAAAAGGAAAFAPLLLAGLSPNAIIAAAAPIGCIACRECYLQKAIMNHFGMQDLNQANAMMSNTCKIYFAQNDSRILNGTFDMQGITLPGSLYDAKFLKVNVTMLSDPYSEVKGTPEMTLSLYKDISQPNLRKKFETQQFLRSYLMKKYEIPLTKTVIAYDQGLQKLSGMIDVREIKYKDYPVQVTTTYTEGGFHKNQAVENPKVKTYAYLIEFEKVK